MIFKSEIRRRTDPSVLTPVVVWLGRFVADHKLTGTGLDGVTDRSGQVYYFDLQLNMAIDRDGDGVVDATEIFKDITRSYLVKDGSTADTTRLNVVNTRLRGSGNLMAGIRAFAKNLIDSHNTSMANMYGLTDTAATHTDVDDDNPITYT